MEAPKRPFLQESPSGLGEQPIYRCLVGLQVDREVQDAVEQRFGVRGVEILEKPAPVMVINGEEVFCKGGDWRPADLLASRVNKARLRSLVRLAKEANFNTLRVEASERPEFYDACDEMGIMVWQNLDCKVPQDTADLVKRLRNHPSIVAWTGNDEEAITDMLRRIDRSRPYRPACLGSRIEVEGPPVVESVRKFIPEKQLFPPGGEVWEYHGGSQEMIDRAEQMMAPSDSVEEFVSSAGVAQGELIKVRIEQARREKHSTPGALLAAYNDCWPAISASVVDYYLRPKIAYYYAKRAFAPVIVSFERVDDRVRVYVTSDDPATSFDGRLRVGVLSFESSDVEFESIRVKVSANASEAVWESEPLESILPDPTRQCIAGLLDVRGEVIAKNFYYAQPPARMRFPRPALLVEREQIDEKLHRMVVAANGFARSVAILDLPKGARPSDNYFEALPGEPHEVIIRNLTKAQARSVRIDLVRAREG